ncbi:frataxin homolog, mitochondrial [Monosporozyma servazzii]
MYRLNLLQSTTRNTLLLSRRQFVKGTISIAIRSLSNKSLNGNNKNLLVSTRASSSINTFKRFYSEKSTISTNGTEVPKEITDLPLNTYHNEADKFLDTVFEQLEILSEDHPDLIPEVELNQGVMTLNLTKIGPYVINKQPPNKQIWFASPLSGPNRFDFYQNDWISLRDNTKLIDIINEEVRIAMPGHQINITKEIDE